MTTLPTFSTLPIASALRIDASSLAPDQQARAARASVGLAEIPNRMLVHIRGNEADIVLQVADMKIGDARANESAMFARLRRDEFIWLGSRHDLSSNYLVMGSHPIVQTDITHGRCILLLVGKDAPRVLPKVCGLDFADAQFPNLYAAQTSLAKVRTLILRADIDVAPAYGLIVDRSLAAYVWRVVFDAASEFAGIALSYEGLNALRIGSSW